MGEGETGAIGVSGGWYLCQDDAAAIRANLGRLRLQLRLQHWEAEAPNAIMGWTDRRM
jgi:hypothetical protein